MTNRVVRRLAPSARAARVASLVRNQCDMLIGYHLAPAHHADVNGEEWLVRRVAPHTRRFLDVGANVGDWSLLMASAAPDAKGLAVEPGEEAGARLRAVLPPAVRLVEALAGAEEGETAFFEAPDASTHSSAVASHAPAARRRTVRATTVDALLAAEGWDRLDVLKIDTEGFDARVLAGAREALGAQRIGVVQFEYNRPWREAGSTLAGALQLLGDAGYATYVLRASGLEAYRYDDYGEFFRYANFVGVAPWARAWFT